MHTIRPLVFAAIAISLSLTSTARAGDTKETAPTFERDVRPIFKAYCLDCHGGGAELKGKLDLRLARRRGTGGRAGRRSSLASPRRACFLSRLQDGEMPPTEKKVPPSQVAVIERWIAAGARTGRDEPESLPPGIDITPEERAYWAFQPIRRPDPPRAQVPRTGRGAERRSMRSYWRTSANVGRRSRPRRTGSRSCAAQPSISPGCHRRASRSMAFSRTPPPRLTSG